MMDKYDFVLDLFNESRETPAPMDIETARIDIRNFKREAEADPDGWTVPEDITPEEYMEIWNSLYEKSK